MKSTHRPIILFILLAFLSLAQTALADTVNAAKKEASMRPWSVALKTRYFFHSHTSYEFGNPFPPYQTPLSRLEFPLDSWWAGVSLRREFSRFSTGVEAFRNISDQVDGTMMDSDWDDEGRPDVKTIYSESSCRLEPSYSVRGDVDLKVSDWLKLPRWLDLRPCVGLAWQSFSLVTYDGMQYYPAPGSAQPPDPLPGDGISFEQTYWQFFVGFKTAFDLGKPYRLADLKLSTQVDWAYVNADNEDHHLLRIGRRITTDKTRGDAWHALMDFKVEFARHFNANIGLEYLRISTTGTHRLVNELFGIEFRFDHGVKVWSEQMNITMSLEYLF